MLNAELELKINIAAVIIVEALLTFIVITVRTPRKLNAVRISPALLAVVVDADSLIRRHCAMTVQCAVTTKAVDTVFKVVRAFTIVKTALSTDTTICSITNRFFRRAVTV